MGNSEYRQELRQYLPQMHNYTLTHCYSPLSIYRHLYNAEEIMEFRERVMNAQDVDRKVQTFLARYQHIYLVSSLFLKVEGNNNCGNVEYDLSIYYERVVTNLSKINEISFKDSLHCLAVALKGFEILYKNYGHFEIFENMFHICQRGRLKVWCNQNIYKNVPQQYLLGEGREEDMVVKIVNIIDQNTDESCKVFPIRQVIIGLKKVTFSNAIVALRQICRENNFTISEHLESLENFSQFQSLLDIYSPPKRFPKDTLVTFYPKNGKSGRGTHRSNSNSSQTGQKAQPSERGKSAEVIVNPNRRFNLTIAHEENEFPKFVAGRQKNYSKSNSSSAKSGKSGHKPTFKAYAQAQPVLVPHSHLQQFSKINGDSQLRKRNILQEPHHQNIRYNHPQQRLVQQTPQKQVVYFPQEQRYANNAQVYPAQVILQKPTTPQPLPRQASAPVFVPQQFTNMQLEHSIVQPHPEYVRQQQINARYAMPVDQHNVQRNNGPLIPNTVMSHSQIIRNQQGKPIEVQQKPVNIVFNRQPQQPQGNNVEKRCISVPVKVSYQGANPREVAFSPNKQSPSPVQSKFTTSPIKPQPYNQKERLVTLGEISANKSEDLKPYMHKFQLRDDKFHLPQLQSKIELLQSFADNKITTQQFLPNQSHALSNIKWEKSSNSGRDSVTSAFRKDILLQSSNKPSEKKSGDEWRKEESLLRKDSYKNGSKIEEGGFYTNQKLLELIKTGHKSKPYQYPKSTYQEKMKKYEKYGKQDMIKEPVTKQSETSDYYNDLFYKPRDKFTTNSLFGQQVISTPTFGLSQKQSFKKKDPYFNKITAITQKWEEENICSTSNGSRGGVNIHSSNIDQDILQDMHNEGFGMLFKKK